MQVAIKYENADKSHSETRHLCQIIVLLQAANNQREDIQQETKTVLTKHKYLINKLTSSACCMGMVWPT